MGKRKNNNRPKQSSDPNPSPSETYEICGGEIPEIGKYWNFQLSENEREEIVCITRRDLEVNMHLNSVWWDTADYVPHTASVLRLIINSLAKKNGIIDLPSDLHSVLIIQIFEKKFVQIINLRSVWTQIFQAGVFLCWLMTDSWLVWAIASVVCYGLVYLKRREMFFFDTSIIPETLAGLVWFGPLILLAASKGNIGWFPHVAVLPAMIGGVASRWARSGPAVRRVYKLTLAFILFYNVFLVVYLGVYVGKMYAVICGLIFNWSLFTGLLSMAVFVVLMILSFCRDLMFNFRQNTFLKSSCVALCPVSAWYAYSANGTWMMYVWCVTMVFSAGVALPSISPNMQKNLNSIASFLLDLLQYLIMAFQTVTATFVIFNKSRKLGYEWVKFLVAKKTPHAHQT